MSISLLNIFLMLVSLGIAYVLPLELLLFSYAVLGPAHYLTQISWLHDRDYFTQGKLDYLVLVLLCVLMLLVPEQSLNYSFMIAAFLVALVLAYMRACFLKAVCVIVLVLSVITLREVFHFGHALSLLLSSVIHVYFFTGLFIVHGAIKRRSLLDAISVFVFLLCGIFFFLFPPSPAAVSTLHPGTVFFEAIGALFLDVLSMEQTPEHLTMVLAFFAFSYTYHYLNWFSKTKIIGWHEIPWQRALVIVVLYVFSLAVYAYSYTAGVYVLLSLSLLHVMLEFPLNHRTIVGILSAGREGRKTKS